jgi:hypothetical protein
MKILKFNEFSAIFEEELPVPEIPMDPSMTGEPAPAAPAGNGEVYKILFINADKEWAAEYPTGGGIKKYKHYEIKSADLTKWLEEIKLTDQAQELKDGLSGKEELTKDQFFKLKQGLRDKTLNYKELAEVEVEYDEDGTPYTSDLNVTFLKPTSDKDDNA